MTHLLPHHSYPDAGNHSSLQSALSMDPNQQHPPPPPHATPGQPSPPGQVRKRKKGENGDESPSAPAEPRRLRRSHEACARCRSKKIKCDSKHPRCSACASAGVPCHQEDRYRQQLTPRGHTERLERQLAQCEALLKRHIPNFHLSQLDDILAREGINIDNVNPVPQMSPAFQFSPGSSPTSSHYASGPPPPGPSNQQPGPKVYPYGPPPPHMGTPPGAYQHPMPPMYGGPPPGSPYAPHMGPPGFAPHGHPGFAPPPMHPGYGSQPLSADIKGQDPNMNDVSNETALAKSFGVSAAIVNDLNQPAAADREDLAVGSGCLTSGRDRDLNQSSLPRDQSKWMTVSLSRTNVGNLIDPPKPTVPDDKQPHAIGPSVTVWLPKDRKTVKHIVSVYFTRLNFHRPVFSRAEFEATLDALYEQRSVQHDPGYICSFYLILALGSLSELSHVAGAKDRDGKRVTDSSTSPKKMMPKDWPEHEEYFERALAVKPDLRVTISSLQALILLQWYLYTERQGRTLWRLVGSLVRLGIELGLHHDPTAQGETFTEEECLLRIRLWGIVMMHDRGTSLLLGRPLGISPSDSNTPRPSRSKNGTQPDFSEHFLLTHPVAEIQADIINSLYTPRRQSGDAIMRHATRIIKNMVEFRNNLPEKYRYYFEGTSEWTIERRAKLVESIQADEGLTLLKVGITRILLLRALFSAGELSYPQRLQALIDAIVTSHNIIIVHNQLIRFPDIAFFVSPIPLHIAAMVILFGHMSKCERITKQMAMEDVWMALDMLPRFRWRWERKDLNGGHPLISKLAEKVLGVNLNQVGPPSQPVLMPEQDWSTDFTDGSPALAGAAGGATMQGPGAQQSTPKMGQVFGGYGAGGNGGGAGAGGRGQGHKGPMSRLSPADKKLVDLPAGLFYPFYPENTQPDVNGAGGSGHAGGGGGGAGPGQQGPPEFKEFGRLLAANTGYSAYQQSQDSFVLEEKDVSAQVAGQGVPMWMQAHNGDQRQMNPYAHMS